jgi:hypothetical protein
MIDLLAFVISFWIGYLILRILRPLKAIDVFLIPGVGLGVSAQIVFYSLLALNRIDSLTIIVSHMVVLVSLFLYNRFCIKRASIKWNLNEVVGVFILLSFAVIACGLFAAVKPYGEWDAWSYWNYHANYILRAGTYWPRVFQYDMQAQHPWMLSCMVVWGWVMAGGEPVIVPIALSIILSVSCVGLLVCALKEYIHFYWALLAGVFLISVPFYLSHGTSQYADILLAYNLLAAIILIGDLIKAPTGEGALLTGLFLGLMAASKDNGIMAAILLLVMVIVYLRKVPQFKDLIRPLLLSVGAVGISVVLMKSFYLHNINNHAYSMSFSGLIDVERWKTIGNFICVSVLDPKWGMLWPLGVLVLLFLGKKWAQEPGIRFILRFLILYVIFYAFVYVLAVSELQWLLNVSFDRLLFLLAPTFVFVIFYTLCKKEA